MLLASLVIWLIGANNVYTPAGYVGYVTQGSVFGKAKFVGLQTGPTSSGKHWLYKVVNVSVTPYTYDQSFTGNAAVLSHDNVKTEFHLHTTFRIRPSDVRQFVEQFSTLQEADKPDQVVLVAFNNFVLEPLRTFARDEIQKIEALKIKDDTTPASERIHARALGHTKGTPFDISATVVGNIQYPDTISAAVAEKIAATQVLERKTTELEIAKKDAEIRVENAKGISDAMVEIQGRLTDRYLTYLAIEAQKAMAGSPNHTVQYIPVGPMGIPLVGTLDLGVGSHLGSPSTAQIDGPVTKDK